MPFALPGQTILGRGARRLVVGGIAAAGPAPAELILNGGFSSGTAWTTLNDASIGFGALNMNGGTGVQATQTTAALVSGKYYELTYTLINADGPAVRASINNGAVLSTSRSIDGAYIERLLAASTSGVFDLRCPGGGSFAAFDNVSLVGPYNTSTVGGA